MSGSCREKSSEGRDGCDIVDFDLVVGGDATGQGERFMRPGEGPGSYRPGVLGMPGMTAHVAQFAIERHWANETAAVLAAGGAVGSAAGQVGEILACGPAPRLGGGPAGRVRRRGDGPAPDPRPRAGPSLPA